MNHNNDSISEHELREGTGDWVLGNIYFDDKPATRPEHEGIDVITYFACQYCGVVQKGFYSKCPNCGAPMKLEDECIFESKPIPTSSIGVGESYTIPESFYSKGMITTYHGQPCTSTKGLPNNLKNVWGF